MAGNFTANFTAETFGGHSESSYILARKLALPFLILDPAVLLYFAAVFPRRRWVARSNVGTALLFATPTILAVWLPFQGVDASLTGATPFRILLIGHLAVAYLAALVLIVTGWLAEHHPSRRRLLRLLVIAFAIAIIPRVAVIRADLASLTVGDFSMFLIAPGLLAAIFVPAWILRPDRRADVARVALVTALLVGLLVALWVPNAVSPAGVPIPLQGGYTLRWVVFGAIVSYAILRYQVFDVEVRLQRGASLGIGAALLFAAFLGVRELIRIAVPTLVPPVPEIAGVLAAVAMVVPAGRAAQAGSARLVPPKMTGEAFLRQRKLEVYASAVGATLEAGHDPETDAELVRLREELRLTPSEHRDVVTLAAAERQYGSAGTAAVRKGALLQGRYQVGDQIGGGLHGRTYLARDERSGAEVVLKELRPEWRADERAVRRFEREAAVLQSLEHPNVVRILDRFERGGVPFLVLEYLSRGGLDRRLREGPLDTHEAVQVASDVLHGLSAIHQAGVVHRDIKPSNILFAADGTAKVSDFGVAQMDASEELTLATLEGSQPGTLRYMSPEQARGAPVDARTDLYSTGLVLYEMLTGKPHIDLGGLSDFEAREALQRRRPALPAPGIAKGLGRVLARSLARDPARRFQSAAEFAEALGPWRREAPTA